MTTQVTSDSLFPAIGDEAGLMMHSWMADLWPLPRSITGEGLRASLSYLSDLIPGLEMHSIESGTEVGDWTIPDEWHIRDAHISNMTGRRLVDFQDSNLHVVNYSVPINRTMSRDELEPFIHFREDLPNAVPYLTSYYEPSWGFCLTREQYDDLGRGPFNVVIDSDLAPGQLHFADVLIPGETSEEVLLTTYACHPSMANNELSGPVVMAALAQWLWSLPKRHYSYRIYIGPETIGAVAYLSLHLAHLRKHVRAGWVITCVGDERAYSYLPSRSGKSLADRVSIAALKDLGLDHQEYRFADRGSDERQWCWPNVDLPVCSLMRSKYGTYPEYHTSLDNLTLVTPEGLRGSLALLTQAISILESNTFPRVTTVGEPQLSRRNLYPTLGGSTGAPPARHLLNFMAVSDGQLDLLEIASFLGLSFTEANGIFMQLTHLGLLTGSRTPVATSE